jgi:FkbH-like protein
MFQFNYFARPIEWRGDRAMAATDSRDKLILSWAEHCIECAAPSCYASCDLYAPTEAGKCRRIENGLVPVKAGQRSGVELRFKRWGKLEAQGNAALISAGQARTAERFAALAARQVHGLGQIVGRFSDAPRWATAHEAFFKRFNTWLEGRRKPSDPAPNLVVVEAENLESAPCELLLTIAVDKARLTRDLTASQLPPPVSIPITLAPGMNCLSVPVGEAAAVFECGLPFNFSLAPLGSATPHLILFELEVVFDPAQAATPVEAGAAEFTMPAKLVVFDLDNTLWDGVLLEGDVRLREGIRELFVELDERGILLSVASKNAPADGMERLASLGLDEFMLFPQIGWLPKSRSIKTIVETIDIGIDSVIFIDDNPFERAEVSAVHPRVEVLDDRSITTLLNHPRLQGAKTAESRSRRKMYQEAVVRTQAAGSFGDDYIEFLRSCELVLTIRPDTPADHDRIAELVQRTNQLNFSGRKYDRAAIAAALQDDRTHLVIECSDRFGSYGTVGFCMAHFEQTDGAPRVVVDDFMLSCRVQGKFIEQALIHHLVNMAGTETSEVFIDFRKTDRNRPAQLVLEEIGFSSGNAGGYSLDPRQVDLSVPFMTVRTA